MSCTGSFARRCILRSMRMRLPAVVVPVISLLAMTACGGSDPSRDGVRSLHAPITDSATGPGERAGTWSSADQRTRWHATLDGPLVTRIDETVTYTDSARATRTFEFDADGRLSMAREDRIQVTYGTKATPDTLHVVMQFSWLADSLVRAEKTLNGEARLAQPFDVDNLRYHGVELLMTARAGAAILFPGGK